MAVVTVKGGNVETQATASILSNDPDNLICFGEPVLFTGLPGGMPNYKFYLNGVQVQDGANGVYLNSTMPIIDYYDQQGKLQKVDAGQDVNAVLEFFESTIKSNE